VFVQLDILPLQLKSNNKIRNGTSVRKNSQEYSVYKEVISLLYGLIHLLK